MSKESAFYRANLHWITFVPSVAFLVLAMPLFVVKGVPYIAPLALIALAIVGLVTQYLNLKTAYLEVFEDKVCIRNGIFTRNITSVPLKRIESVDIKQSLLACLLNYGSIIITGSGGSHYFMHKIGEPLTCRRQIEQQLFLLN